MKRLFKNRFLAFILIGLFLIGCTALMAKYNPWYKNPECTLLADLQPPVTDGFIFDKLRDRNPCALEHGLIFAAQGAVKLTSKDAQDIYDWAGQGIEYVDEGLNGEKFIHFVSENLGGILGKIAGDVVLWVGDGLKVIPKDAIIKGGDAQVVKYILGKVQDKMTEIMSMATVKAAGGGAEVLLRF